MRRVMILLAALLLVLATAVPAAAGPDVRQFYSYSEADSFDCDGQVFLDATFEGSGLFMLKAGRHGDPTPYWFDNYQYLNTYTNPLNGKWFTIEGNALYKDLRIAAEEGTIHHFVAQTSGQFGTWRDMTGKVVLRDNGRELVSFSVDTLGDNNPDNDIFVDGSFELLTYSGHQPGRDIDGCTLAASLVG